MKRIAAGSTSPDRMMIRMEAYGLLVGQTRFAVAANVITRLSYLPKADSMWACAGRSGGQNDCRGRLATT
jgi:hypothetical protein